MTELVRLEHDAELGLTTLVLDRPEKLNAFSLELLAQAKKKLADLKKAAMKPTLKGVAIVSTSPKAFCAGADLGERATMKTPQVRAVLASQRAIVDAVAALPVPTFAILEGVAFGGGFELALACDFRLCSPSAQMGLTETRLGIIPGAGGTQRLSRLVGVTRAKELILLGRRLNAEEALALGLVSRVSPEPRQVLREWMADINKAAPLAIRAAKRALDGGTAKPLPAALTWERQCYEQVLRSEDRVEGLKAFMEKRSPSYQGK